MRKPNRLKKYDYSQPGYYFITICTYKRTEYFGHIAKGLMALNDLGRIAQEVWQRKDSIYKGIGLDEFVIMPNHIHAVIVIKYVAQPSGLPQLPTLSQIIGSYKNVVSKEIRKNLKAEFGWQPSFYDHVIRKDGSLDKIREYIKNNPVKWELDRNNPENLWM